MQCLRKELLFIVEIQKAKVGIVPAKHVSPMDNGKNILFKAKRDD